MNQIYQTAIEHKAALGVLGAWALRELHNLWPFMRPSASLPFLRANGGLAGIASQILWGKIPVNQNNQGEQKL